ncbi:MAG: hypothetical protein KF764_23590 [Labilithrix sp.]|nr:hypothetical protein [Labilithrix sp.]
MDALGGTSALEEPSIERSRPEPHPKEETWPWNLVANGFIRDRDLTNFLSQQYRVPTIDLDAYEVSADIVKLVSVELCTKHLVLPISRAGNSLIVAMADPANDAATEALTTETGCEIEPVIASDAAIRVAIKKYYGPG